jgi:hypothetical protein
MISLSVRDDDIVAMKGYDDRFISGSMCIFVMVRLILGGPLLTAPEAIVDAIFILLEAGQWLAQPKYRLAIRGVAQCAFSVAFLSFLWAAETHVGKVMWSAAFLLLMTFALGVLGAVRTIREIRKLRS